MTRMNNNLEESGCWFQGVIPIGAGVAAGLLFDLDLERKRPVAAVVLADQSVHIARQPENKE